MHFVAARKKKNSKTTQSLKKKKIKGESLVVKDDILQ